MSWLSRSSYQSIPSEEEGRLSSSPSPGRRKSYFSMRKVLMGMAGLSVGVVIGLCASSSSSISLTDSELSHTRHSGHEHHHGHEHGHDEKGEDEFAVCNDPDFTKKTLKAVRDLAMSAALTPEHSKGEYRFELSGIISVGDYFYAVSDNSWAISKIKHELQAVSPHNIQIGDPNRDPAGLTNDTESGFEAIVYNDVDQKFYIVRESIDIAADDEKQEKKSYRGIVYEATLTGDQFQVLDVTHTEFQFDSDNKGFEGAAGIHDDNGDYYLLGLCEGNYCSAGKKGREKGNGRVVVMKKKGAVPESPPPLGRVGEQSDEAQADTREGWETVKILHLPKEVDFQDYSAISYRQMSDGKVKVLVASQENAQVWMGEFEGLTKSGNFDPENTKFASGGKILNFPRNGGCKKVYCNVEGIHFIEDHLAVGASDKMKSHGRQPFECMEKDQSVHLFVLP